MQLTNLLQWFRDFLMESLCQGPLPRHLAIIMDGNRRYAREHGISIEKGHMAGVTALNKGLETLYKNGIEVVTIYAFSLENFHRPKEQVDDLMKLLENLMVELNEEDSVAMKYDVQVRVLGRLDLLVEGLQRAITTTVNTTRGNQSKVLNVCIAYTGRDEINTAIKGTVTGGVLPDKITAQGLTDNMMIKVPTPDILIRTSGVCRLSDFMLWQCHQDTQIEVVEKNWPDFGMWDMCLILLKWQSRRGFRVRI